MKFSIITLGCKVNAYESQYYAGQLEELGYDSNFISNKKSISLYDEIVLKMTEDKLKSIK